MAGVGIDVCKPVLDVCWSNGVERQFANDLSGWKALARLLSKDDRVVLEATGGYEQGLLDYLAQAGFWVCRVNAAKHAISPKAWACWPKPIAWTHACWRRWPARSPRSRAMSAPSRKARKAAVSAIRTLPGDLNVTDLPIYAAHGGIFNDPTPISFTQVGTADMTFTSCTAMTLHYTFTDGEFAGLSGTVAEQPVGPVGACQ